MAVAFVNAQDRTFVQAVGGTFVQGNGLELSGFVYAVEDGDDFTVDVLRRCVRHDLERLGFAVHFQQEIAFADFGNGFFHNHRLRGLGRHFHQRVQAGVVFAVFQVFAVFVGSGVQRAVGVGQGADDAAEDDFLTEVFTGIGISQVLDGTVNQIAAGFGNPVGVHAFAFAVHDAVVRTVDQARCVLGLHLVDELRMLHEHAVEVHVDGLDAVA